MDEVQYSLTLLKNMVTQVRTEVEADRNERWKNENERNQWIADLRAAVAKIDASMDAKIMHHADRLNAKLMADKMDMMQLLEEYRELMTGTDFKRISSQMLEFSRINDHLLALERWIHTEFGHIKRVCQFILTDTDARLQTLAMEVLSGMKTWHMVLLHQDDDDRTRLEDINDAVDEVARIMQTRLFALEDVMPMEVKARQQSDDKLRHRVESGIKSLSRAIETTREECVAPHVQLKSRMTNLEEVQRRILDQVDEKQEIVKETMQEFVKDSDTMLRKLAHYVEHERQQTLGSAVIVQTSNSDDNAEAPVILAPPVQDSGVDPVPATFDPASEEKDAVKTGDIASVVQPLSPEMLAELRSEWVQFFETQLPTYLTDLKYALFDDVEEKFAECMEKLGLQEQLQGLQTWTTNHAQECRRCYEYLTWALESATCDNTVASCLSGMIDQVVESTARDELQWLKDQSLWSIEQLELLATQIKQQQQILRHQQDAQSASTPSIGRAYDADEVHESDNVMRGTSPVADAVRTKVDAGEVPGCEDNDAADADRWL
uniref:Uncharacterized protein n=1 Tax=Globisporangium ultimum (strain ATCC 200006 / CBS 805.95 / DAOM BR144) TaxID=431595 RepID=K3WV05_GLOUD